MVVCPPEYDAVRKVSPPDQVPHIEKPPQEKPEKKEN
jgi:NADH-quinone oxidoreductase subunit F